MYVLKQIRVKGIGETKQRTTLQEVLIFRRLKHPSVTRYYTAFLDDSNMYILMEHCAGGDCHRLAERVRQSGRLLEEGAVWNYIAQVNAGLTHLHERRILHRDIKAMNILLTSNNRAKIADLGVSCILPDRSAVAGESRARRPAAAGTPLFLPPEIVRRDPYDTRADMWCLGCFAYNMAALRPPFVPPRPPGADDGGRQRVKKLHSLILNEDPPPLPKPYSGQLRDAILRLLSKDPARRPTAGAFHDSIPRAEIGAYDVDIRTNEGIYNISFPNRAARMGSDKKRSRALRRPGSARRPSSARGFTRSHGYRGAVPQSARGQRGWRSRTTTSGRRGNGWGEITPRSRTFGAQAPAKVRVHQFKPSTSLRVERMPPDSPEMQTPRFGSLGRAAETKTKKRASGFQLRRRKSGARRPPPPNGVFLTQWQRSESDKEPKGQQLLSIALEKGTGGYIGPLGHVSPTVRPSMHGSARKTRSAWAWGTASSTSMLQDTSEGVGDRRSEAPRIKLPLNEPASLVDVDGGSDSSDSDSVEMIDTPRLQPATTPEAQPHQQPDSSRKLTVADLDWFLE